MPRRTNSTISEENDIQYLPSHGEDFAEMLRLTLCRGVDDETARYLTTGDNLDAYKLAFTATSIDSQNNYEISELLGDVIANGIIKWYALARFPQLENPQGVDILSRLLIKYGAKQSFYKIAERLGFWSFIAASVIHRREAMKSLLEDSFEAFCGTTMRLLKSYKGIGVGYEAVYNILSSLLDEIPMSLEYDDLRDAKTRLKESFDAHKTLGVLIYTEVRDTLETDDGTISISESTAWCIPHQMSITQRKVDDAYEAKERYLRKGDSTTTISNPYTVYTKLFNKIKNVGEKLGSGSASLKTDAQQRAASQAIETLKKKEMYKGAPDGYNELIKPLK